jgi:hypothetical protein
LAKTGQASHCPVTYQWIETTLFIESATQADHFLDLIDNTQFTMPAVCHQQVETVAAKVNRGVGISPF